MDYESIMRFCVHSVNNSQLSYLLDYINYFIYGMSNSAQFCKKCGYGAVMVYVFFVY
jgi:hypothetical protein